jgi:hypothetical protein
MAKILSFGIPALALIIGFYAAAKLRHKNGSDIRLVWYFFSLALTTTTGVTLWANHAGWIDEHGTFQGTLGTFIGKLLHVMLDLNTDMAIVASLAALVSVPQVLGYFLSGLSGWATAPVLFKQSIAFVVWSAVKSFALAAGILFPLAILGSVMHWKGWDALGMTALLLLALAMISLAFSILAFYRDAEEMFNAGYKRIPRPLRRLILQAHRWLTRNEDPRDSRRGGQREPGARPFPTTPRQ